MPRAFWFCFCCVCCFCCLWARASRSSPPSSRCRVPRMRPGWCAPRSRGCAGSSVSLCLSVCCCLFDTLIARAAQLTKEESARLDAHLAGREACRELARAVVPVDDRAAVLETGIAATMHTLSAAPSGEVHERHELGTDRYRITGEVGRGGLGRVLRALDQVLDRPVALKELFSDSAAMRSRFVREALITARLQHPSIVPVYDAGHLGDRSPFYAMKLVAGRPLDKSIAEAKTLAERLALLP